MKRILSLLLAFTIFLCLPALAEESAQSLTDAGFVGIWIENTGYGTLTIRADGSSTMVYYDGTTSESNWGLTDEGAKFLDGMWLNSPMTLLDENTLNVNNGWCIFTREGFLPITDSALLLGAEPVGEDGEPFLGVWELTTLITEGKKIDPALSGMTIHITFNADGTIISDDGLEPYTTTWFVSYGSAVVEGDILILDENDQLVLNAGNDSMIFTRVLTSDTDPANPADPTPVDEEGAKTPELSDADELLALLELLAQLEGMDDLSALPENHQGFVGEWHLCYLMTGGLTGDLRSMGITGSLSLYSDYTGWLTGIAEEDASWYEDEYGVIRFGESGMPLFLIDAEADGLGVYLQYGTEAGGCMIFHQDPEAVWTPGRYPLQTPAGAVETTTPAASGGEIRLGTKYVCTSYSAGGVPNDASILGAEYAIFFREDGLADFTLAGFTTTDLGCTVAEDGSRTVHYAGNAFLCVPTEAGIDMDFFGIIYHMVPAE